MSGFPSLIRNSGPFGLVLVVLGLTVLFLSVRATWVIMRNGSTGQASLRSQVNGVLFWGVASAVLGFLGQCHGVYLGLNEIIAAPEISPWVVAEGFVISFAPTLFGFGILAFAFVVWISLRFFPPIRTRAFILPMLGLVFLSLPACSAVPQETPEELTQGVWAMDGGPNVFLWQFTSGSDGSMTCMVHDIMGGLKYTETPCATVRVQGEKLELEMPNGVRYEGPLALEKGSIDGSLHYVDGTSWAAPLKWASLEQYPTLKPRPSDEGAYLYTAPQDRGDGLSVGQARDSGVDPAALERALQAIVEGDAGFLKSFLVLRGGTLLLEEYFHGYGPDDLSPLQSCTKSISSLLVGLAIQEGRIASVDKPLLDFFPQDRSSAGSGWEELTLEDLLTMSLALDWSPQEAQGRHGTGPEAFRRILSRDVVGKPGEDFEYVNMNVNLIAGILHEATGSHAEAFAERALFEPLGIEKWDWDYSKKDGFNLMDGSLRLRPRDMAKIGAMAMDGGVWKGEQVVDEAWIRESLTPRLSTGTPGEGYGYLWWTMNVPGPGGELVEVHFANGWGSQFILLFPTSDLVVVTTGGNHENGKHLAIGQVLIQELLPGVG